MERRPSRPRRSLGDLIKSCFALFEATDKLLPSVIDLFYLRVANKKKPICSKYSETDKRETKQVLRNLFFLCHTSLNFQQPFESHTPSVTFDSTSRLCRPVMSLREHATRGYVGNSGYYHSLIVLDCTSLFNWLNKPCCAGSKLKQFS